MHEYLIDCDVKVALRLKARNAAEARQMVDRLLDCADANFGCWPNGDPAIGEASVHTRSIAEIDGEPMENAGDVSKFEEHQRGLQLFNCCTALAEPDWSRFVQLEIAGCKSDPENECTQGLISAGDAEFFTVYGRFPPEDGTCEAITDITDPCNVLAIAGELAHRSRLPVIIHPSLMFELR